MTRSSTSYAACATFALIILAHAGLLPLSRWQGDEYLDFVLLRQQGWTFFIDRLLHWSARPWSEIWFNLYGLAANAAHRPLAGRFDGLLWACLAAACLAPAWFGASAGRRPVRLAFGMALLALFLLGHGISEMFYWPAGAAAYLPTLAGITWLFWCTADGLATRRLSAAAALTLAAGSSEVGIFGVLAFAGCLLLANLRRPARLFWLLPPVLVALTDLWIVLHARVGTIEILGPESRYVHHAMPSLLAALPGFFLDLVSSGADAPNHADIATHAGAALLILLGARWCLAPARPDSARSTSLLCLGAALLMACLATRASAFYQFGELCCERHETMRQCLIQLALAALGTWSATLWPPRAMSPIPLLAAALLLAIQRAPDLLSAYRLAPQAIQARAQTWESGLGAGNETLLFVLPPPNPILHGLGGFDPGQYALGKDTPWHLRGLMMYFGKTRLTIRALR